MDHDRQVFSVSSVEAVMSFLDGARYEEANGRISKLLHRLGGAPEGFKPEELAGRTLWPSSGLLDVRDGKSIFKTWLNEGALASREPVLLGFGVKQGMERMDDMVRMGRVEYAET